MITRRIGLAVAWATIGCWGIQAWAASLDPGWAGIALERTFAFDQAALLAETERRGVPAQVAGEWSSVAWDRSTPPLQIQVALARYRDAISAREALAYEINGIAQPPRAVVSGLAEQVFFSDRGDGSGRGLYLRQGPILAKLSVLDRQTYPLDQFLEAAREMLAIVAQVEPSVAGGVSRSEPPGKNEPVSSVKAAAGAASPSSSEPVAVSTLSSPAESKANKTLFAVAGLVIMALLIYFVKRAARK